MMCFIPGLHITPPAAYIIHLPYLPLLAMNEAAQPVHAVTDPGRTFTGTSIQHRTTKNKAETSSNNRIGFVFRQKARYIAGRKARFIPASRDIR